MRPPDLDRAGWHDRLGWMPWLVLAGVACVLTVAAPLRQTVVPVYHGGAARFFAGETLHEEGIYGFLYLPAFALVFGPFHALPGLAGDVLWRLVGIALLATGTRRLCAALAPAGQAGRCWHLAGLLALAGSFSAARNGQANLWIAALTLHAALDLADGRRGRAAAVLALSLAVKPIAIVPVLLLGALDPRLAPRLALGVLCVLALPFLFQAPDYVWAQHVGFFEKTLRAQAPPTPYTEAFGGLQRLGLDVPQGARQAVRALLALATLGACAWIQHRHGRRRGCLAALALACAYLMAFNPVTEANSYVILAGVVAPWAAAAWCAGRRLEGALLGATCLLLGTHLVGGAVHEATKRWLKPLQALGFAAWILARRAAPGGSATPAPDPRAAPRPAAG